tara:strand:+ start:6314 stop:6691 length:378 start_codon:yes stop_codon:yes gene_type:complete
MADATFTALAAADLSGKRHHLMRLSAANTINQASEAVNAGLVGVLTNQPESGEFGAIKFLGVQKVVTGAAVTAGAMLTTNASGRAIDITSGSEEMTFGRALEASGADGDEVEAVLIPPVRWVGSD